jgi:hypothetical protein
VFALIRVSEGVISLSTVLLLDDEFPPVDSCLSMSKPVWELALLETSLARLLPLFLSLLKRFSAWRISSSFDESSKPATESARRFLELGFGFPDLIIRILNQ